MKCFARINKSIYGVASEKLNAIGMSIYLFVVAHLGRITTI